MMGRYRKAAAAMSAAVRLKADHVDAHYHLAANYNELGMHREAIASLKRVVRFRPDALEARSMLVKTYLLAGDQKSAARESASLKKLSSAPAAKLLH